MTHVQAGLCVAPQSALHCCVRDGVRSDIFRPQAPSAHQRARPSSSLLPSIYVLYTLRTFPEPPLLRECSCGSDAWRTRRTFIIHQYAQPPFHLHLLPARATYHHDQTQCRLSAAPSGSTGRRFLASRERSRMVFILIRVRAFGSVFKCSACVGRGIRVWIRRADRLR